MATNIIYDRIFKGLKLILGKSAVVEGDRMPRAAEYIQLSEESYPELIENTGPTTAMLYSINIDLITNRAKKPKYISQQLSNIRNLLNTNTAYTTGGVYYWHNGTILATDPERAVDENGQEIYAARLLWTATHTEQRS
jgi:hypothetical protein